MITKLSEIMSTELEGNTKYFLLFLFFGILLIMLTALSGIDEKNPYLKYTNKLLLFNYGMVLLNFLFNLRNTENALPIHNENMFIYRRSFIFPVAFLVVVVLFNYCLSENTNNSRIFISLNIFILIRLVAEMVFFKGTQTSNYIYFTTLFISLFFFLLNYKAMDKKLIFLILSASCAIFIIECFIFGLTTFKKFKKG